MTRLAAVAGVIGAVCATGAFASAGALPQPAQHAASAVLGTVGISVPNGGEQPADEPPPTVASTTPPAANAPSQRIGKEPGAVAPPAGPSSPSAPRDGRNEFGGDQSNATSPGNAKGHGNDHSSKDPWSSDRSSTKQHHGSSLDRQGQDNGR